MQGPSEPSLGRALLLTLAAMAFWFAAIWLGVLAMFWYLIPLGVVCVIYVTAMFHLIELSAVPRLLLTLAAPAPAFLVAYFRSREEDTLGQAAIMLTAQFISLLAVIGSAPAAVAAIRSRTRS